MTNLDELYAEEDRLRASLRALDREILAAEMVRDEIAIGDIIRDKSGAAFKVSHIARSYGHGHQVTLTGQAKTKAGWGARTKSIWRWTKEASSGEPQP